MAVYYFPKIKLAPGHNSQGSLASIESIITSDNKRFWPPSTFSNYKPGLKKRRTDGTIYYAGFPSTFWIFSGITRKQHEYLMTTYCAGGFSGLVTVQFQPAVSTYKIYNAVMNIPDPTDMDRHFQGFKDYRIDFNYLEYLSDVA